MGKARKKKTLFYKLFYPIVKLTHGKQMVTFREPVPQDEPAVFVANHAQAFGPISMIVNFDRQVRPWIAADVMFKETAADFCFVQFFAGNIKKHKRWNMFKARFTARVLVNVFSNVGGIPVYYDRRMLKTFSDSVEALKQGDQLVIFGETPKRFSPYVAEISDGFVALAQKYFNETGKCVKFYPVYIAPKYICVGEHTDFDPSTPLKVERARVARYVRDGINDLALSLPAHKPIPTYTEEYFLAIEQQKKDMGAKN